MADILLFNQYFTSKKEAPEYVLAQLPLNLIYLASFLKEKGLNCSIYELGIFDYTEVIEDDNDSLRCGISNKSIQEIIEKENPKIIGIGCVYTMHFWDVLAIARYIKSINPKITVILGGNHATAFANQILKETTIDYIVRGEGEITFHELCSSILDNKSSIISIQHYWCTSKEIKNYCFSKNQDPKQRTDKKHASFHVFLQKQKSASGMVIFTHCEVQICAG